MSHEDNTVRMLDDVPTEQVGYVHYSTSIVCHGEVPVHEAFRCSCMRCRFSDLTSTCHYLTGARARLLHDTPKSGEE